MDTYYAVTIVRFATDYRLVCSSLARHRLIGQTGSSTLLRDAFERNQRLAPTVQRLARICAILVTDLPILVLAILNLSDFPLTVGEHHRKEPQLDILVCRVNRSQTRHGIRCQTLGRAPLRRVADSPVRPVWPRAAEFRAGETQSFEVPHPGGNDRTVPHQGVKMVHPC